MISRKAVCVSLLSLSVAVGSQWYGFFGWAQTQLPQNVETQLRNQNFSDQQINQIEAAPDRDRNLPGQLNEQYKDSESTHSDKVPQTDPDEAEVIDQSKEGSSGDDPSLRRTFKVNKIRVEGVHSIPQSKVDVLVAEYEGKELSFVDLRELSDKLTQLYKDRGLMTSVVYIPPQRIENGVVTLKSAEGILGNVSFQKDEWFGRRAVMPRMLLRDGDVFDADDLKRSLRRVNENPDLQVKAVLMPGKEQDQTDIRLEAEDRFPVHVEPFYDNLGRRLIGYQRGGVTTSINNVLGFGDQAFNSVSWSKESFGTVSHYELPIGPHGTKVAMDHSFSTLELGKEFEDLGIRGRAQIFSPSISQEIINTDRAKIWVDAAFDWKNITTDLNRGDTPLFKDQLRVLRPGVNLDLYDRFGRTLMRHEFGIGLDIWGASNGQVTGRDLPIPSRAGAKGQFFRYTGSVTRFQKMPWNTYAILRGVAQLSADRLVSAEQIQMGGAFTVRGYREGVVIGDQGYNFSGEWRAPFFLVPKNWKIPFTKKTWRDNIQLVSFVDYGAIFVNDPAQGVDDRAHLLSAGVGLRARITRFIVGRIDLGMPMLRRQPDNLAPRFHFGLSSELF